MERRRIRNGLLALLAAGVVAGYVRMLPSPLFDAPYSTVWYARGGELLGARVAEDGQWRFPPGTALSDKYLRAVVEYEDRRFYRHPGVSLPALVRAAEQNRRAGEVVSGGSTLTMQLVRLSRGNPPRTVGDARHAHRVELFEGGDSGALCGSCAVRRKCGGGRGGGVALFRTCAGSVVVGRGGCARGAAQFAGSDPSGTGARGAVGETESAARPAAGRAGAGHAGVRGGAGRTAARCAGAVAAACASAGGSAGCGQGVAHDGGLYASGAGAADSGRIR